MAPVAAPSDLAGRARERREWRAWLAVLDAVNAEARAGSWDRIVPAPRPPEPDLAPLLAGVTFRVGAPALRRWLERLVRAATEALEAPAGLARIAWAEDSQLAALLEAGLAQNPARAAALATALGADANALGVVGAAAAWPLLRACAGRWSEDVAVPWAHGWCPVCAAWPTLAEVRGLERARRLRCGRCAADWQTSWLRCVYCGTDDHARLGSLVLTAERPGDISVELARVATSIDTCSVCRGYLKTVTTLAPTPADDLGLLDLATLELDLAALQQGYARPAGLGVAVEPRVVTAPGRLGGWWRR